MKSKEQIAIYWDASAILSIIFQDTNSRFALKWAESGAVHFVSTLAYAEVCAVLARMNKLKVLSDVLISVGYDLLNRGPWRRTSVNPEWSTLQVTSELRSLRGADLWHLATALKLRSDFPELVLLTFDKKLDKAAKQENFKLLNKV